MPKAAATVNKMDNLKGTPKNPKMPFSNAPGKVAIKASQSMSQPSNPMPGRKRLDSMTGNSKPSMASQSSYAGKPAATSSGFANSRARELGAFKGSVPVAGLRHTKKPETKNKIN